MLSFHAKIVHFRFYIVMVFLSVLENFVVDFKKNMFIKVFVSQNVMFYLPSLFYWMDKSIQISVFSDVFLSS